jgi:adenylate kinase family enzyme
MKKILVIGSGGAGKTTFAIRLGEILGIEVVHLDGLFWKPGWVESSKEDWARTMDRLLGRTSWIMDGNYSGTLQSRIDACDAVIFLDLPRTTCLCRVVERWLRCRGKTRPDMAVGCIEQLNFEFLVWIWNYPSRSRPKIMKLLAEDRNLSKAVQLRTPVQIDRFLTDARDSNSIMPARRGSAQ